ncbi:hypothetical protein RJ639_045153 [Escallonia herrerae]|uniref:PsbP C-terminal domain-containing protein n=1 Tax=Escallonia herrerae TaxID=1293975 RepID=A0AA88W6P6_9ASTE|nr:hypothetical protein RJ639_045153 [Escallonia herrerae]
MATILESIPLPSLSSASQLSVSRRRLASPDQSTPSPRLTSVPTFRSFSRCPSVSCKLTAVHLDINPQSGATRKLKEISTAYETKGFAVPRRSVIALIFSGAFISRVDSYDAAYAQQSVGLREYIDTFDGYSFKYPQNWIQVRGANADIFFRDPFVLDENLSVALSSPSSSKYKSVEDLGPPQEAGKKVLRQYLTEFMSTRLGVRRESSILSTSSRISDDGRMYYQVEVNIKSYANNNELAVMPQDRVARLEWDRRYLSVLGVENNQLYELRLQVPENVFVEEEYDLRQVMDSFRVNKLVA